MTNITSKFMCLLFIILSFQYLFVEYSFAEYSLYPSPVDECQQNPCADGWECCGGVCYDTSTQQCCRDSVVIDRAPEICDISKDCCGGMCFDGTCCIDRQLNPGEFCCGENLLITVDTPGVCCVSPSGIGIMISEQSSCCMDIDGLPFPGLRDMSGECCFEESDILCGGSCLSQEEAACCINNEVVDCCAGDPMIGDNVDLQCCTLAATGEPYYCDPGYMCDNQGGCLAPSPGESDSPSLFEPPVIPSDMPVESKTETGSEGVSPSETQWFMP